jgi:predicted secreted Zn-dependent protease
MTTSQRVPRRVLLRRVGPWIVLASILTGCASPAARTALETLQESCDTASYASSGPCLALALVTGTDADVAGLETASLLGAAITSGRSETTAKATSAKRSDRQASGTRANRSQSTTKPKATRRPPADTKPRRVTRRVPKVRMPSIGASYFGASASLGRFRVTGDTRSEILLSLRRVGPYGGAEGVTQPYIQYHLTFKYDRKGRCRVARTASSAVTMSFHITLPSWTATPGTDHATASWWARELRATAVHERHHVLLWRNALRQANRIVATSSCSTVGDRLNAVWQRATVANCRFDHAEYGISMRACLRR